MTTLLPYHYSPHKRRVTNTILESDVWIVHICVSYNLHIYNIYIAPSEYKNLSIYTRNTYIFTIYYSIPYRYAAVIIFRTHIDHKYTLYCSILWIAPTKMWCSLHVCMSTAWCHLYRWNLNIALVGNAWSCGRTSWGSGCFCTVWSDLLYYDNDRQF